MGTSKGPRHVLFSSILKEDAMQTTATDWPQFFRIVCLGPRPVPSAMTYGEVANMGDDAMRSCAEMYGMSPLPIGDGTLTPEAREWRDQGNTNA